MNAPTRIGLAFAVMAILMTVLWLVQRARKNAGIVDVAWSFGTGVNGVWFALTGSGYAPRRIILAVMAGLWGVRLGWHLWQRVSSEAEDGRYAALRQKWGDRTQPMLFGFFQIQAFWTVLFALPMFLAAENAAPALGVLDFIGILIFLIAVGGETLADRSLARFRADPGNRGVVCREGLWRYSRHPNYFFEWIHWWAYVAIGIGAPLGALTVLGPVLMLLFMFTLTGIPPTERRALESRGDAYREYQRTTSVFVPLPVKGEAL
jgi:steroid 5-alpha reductase family enzyme